MAKEWAKAFYKSRQWLSCRNAYIQSRMLVDGGTCEVCHKQPGYIVHHKITLTPQNIHDPDVSLNHALLSYECKDCHDLHDGHGIATDKKIDVWFDDDGQPSPLFFDGE